MKSNFVLNKIKKVWDYTIPSLNDIGLVKIGFSTRIGAVLYSYRLEGGTPKRMAAVIMLI